MAGEGSENFSFERAPREAPKPSRNEAPQPDKSQPEELQRPGGGLFALIILGGFIAAALYVPFSNSNVGIPFSDSPSVEAPKVESPAAPPRDPKLDALDRENALAAQAINSIDAPRVAKYSPAPVTALPPAPKKPRYPSRTAQAQPIPSVRYPEPAPLVRSRGSGAISFAELFAAYQSSPTARSAWEAIYERFQGQPVEWWGHLSLYEGNTYIGGPYGKSTVIRLVPTRAHSNDPENYGEFAAYVILPELPYYVEGLPKRSLLKVAGRLNILKANHLGEGRPGYLFVENAQLDREATFAELSPSERSALLESSVGGQYLKEHKPKLPGG